jgi:hypothetical protein
MVVNTTSGKSTLPRNGFGYQRPSERAVGSQPGTSLEGAVQPADVPVGQTAFTTDPPSRSLPCCGACRRISSGAEPGANTAGCAGMSWASALSGCGSSAISRSSPVSGCRPLKTAPTSAYASSEKR